MNRNTHPRRLPAIVACLSAALLSLAATGAAAQGFSSVSSAPALAAPATDASATAAPAPSARPADGAGASGATVNGPTDPVPVPVAPTAQLAALGSFDSTSGAVPVLPGTSPTALGRGAGSTGAFEQADKVLVDKSDRKLYLLRGDRVVAEYPVKLGLNPYGHKQQEGDFRTPEGKYSLSRRNPRSDFFLAIQVSYPSREDAAWAKENGWSPGGLIMIHGQPNVPKRPAEFYANRDWTDGCIALTNADMVDVWLRTSVGIPIEIRP